MQCVPAKTLFYRVISITALSLFRKYFIYNLNILLRPYFVHAYILQNYPANQGLSVNGLFSTDKIYLLGLGFETTLGPLKKA